MSLLIIMVPFLALVKVTNNFAVFPICMFPKVRLAGFGISDFGARPEPRTVRSALPLNAMLPLYDPETVGWKAIASVSFCDGARVNGSMGLVTLYPAVAVIVEIVKPDVPELVIVTGKVSDCPTTTSPKRKMVGLTVNFTAAAGVCKPAVNSKLPNKKRTYLETDWGRFITLSVLPRGKRSVKVSIVHFDNEKDLCQGSYCRRKMAIEPREMCCNEMNVRCRTIISTT